MSNGTHLLGFKTPTFLSTRGPGDMLPRASTIASIYETPILPRLETLVGLITRTVIETRIKDIESELQGAGYNYSTTSEKWEYTVYHVFVKYLGVSKIKGPVLVISRDNEGKEYYVNIGLGLLKIDNGCQCPDMYSELAKKVWESIGEASVLEKYRITREVEEKLNELVEKECMVYPSPLTSTGISLDNVSKSTRHGLIYSYILQDYTGLTHGKSYTIGILVDADTRKVQDLVGNGITVSVGPRGRPAILVEEKIDQNPCYLGFTNSSELKIAITPLPLTLVGDNIIGSSSVAVVHPLRIKPLIIQLAKSTIVTIVKKDKEKEEWAKTGMESAYQPGSVVVKGSVRTRKIPRSNSGGLLELFYTV